MHLQRGCCRWMGEEGQSQYAQTRQEKECPEKGPYAHLCTVSFLLAVFREENRAGERNSVVVPDICLSWIILTNRYLFVQESVNGCCESAQLVHRRDYCRNEPVIAELEECLRYEHFPEERSEQEAWHGAVIVVPQCLATALHSDACPSLVHAW